MVGGGGQWEKRKGRWDVEEAKGLNGKLFLCSRASLRARATPDQWFTCRAPARPRDSPDICVRRGFFNTKVKPFYVYQ
jgi:hypothetical protein